MSTLGANPTPKGGKGGGATPERPPVLVWAGQKWWKFRDIARGGDDHPKSQSERAVRMLAAGGFAGACAKTAVAPMERVKVLCQVAGMRNNGVRPGVRDMFVQVYQAGGIRGYWVGNFANVVRIIPQKGFLFAANDVIKGFFRKPGQVHLDPVRSILAGSAAGASSVIVTYPLDYVRSQLMAGEQAYKGILDCAIRTVKTQGPLALYRGLVPSLIGIVPYAGISFAAFDALKRVVPKDSEGHTPTMYKLGCGAVAGFVSQTATYPCDTVRRRIQLQSVAGGSRMYAGTIDCFKQILRNEGAAAFYAGVTANAMRAIPNVAIQFYAYETFKELLGV